MSGRRTGWTPDGWTPGPRTTKRMGGHQLVDADGDGRHGRHPGIPTTAMTPLPLGCRPEVLPGRRRLGRSATGIAQQKERCQGPGHRRDQTAAGSHAAVQPAPRRTALLGMIRVERRAGWWRSSVMAGAEVGGWSVLGVGAWELALSGALGLVGAWTGG